MKGLVESNFEICGASQPDTSVVLAGLCPCNSIDWIVLVAMLEPTEDGSVERPASSTREGTPAAVKPVVEDRMVYKLVKVFTSFQYYVDIAWYY